MTGNQTMTDLMKGKRGLVMGVANERSIAWGIAKALHDEGAELAFSYQGEAFGKRVEPLAASVGSTLMVDVDVMDDASMDACFANWGAEWGSLDFVVHAIAFSDKTELTGRFINTSRENFRNSLTISCYSFIDVARRASELMPEGGTLLTLTYQGSNRVTPFYNVMGVAKAALESSVRYLANDLGPQKIRVNAISPGPMKTLAGAAIGGARKTFKTTEANAPLRANATLEAVGGTAVYLASDYGACTTGEIITVDGGYHVLGMLQPENL
jgi:enoyl-[acyl-carrier protein] reductase I